ncbi:MAG TPA: DUF177 domain-containing protein [Kofleriaceae bacterium]|jgi:uncharacterized protein|nr:DUF177 domain-containing protein [Kofleriaceae bacterium]
MSSESPFKVAVRDLPATRRIEITPVFVAEAVQGMPMRDALDGDAAAERDGGAAELELYEDGTSVFAHGSITGQVTVACSRCIGPVAIPIDERVRVTFLPAHELPAEPDEEGEEGVELASDDLDVFPYDGETVDLEPLVREQFVLAVPFAPLCREDCAGLCPQCGADRNVAPCQCEKPIDPRFGPLAGLKLPT